MLNFCIESSNWVNWQSALQQGSLCRVSGKGSGQRQVSQHGTRVWRDADFKQLLVNGCSYFWFGGTLKLEKKNVRNVQGCERGGGKASALSLFVLTTFILGSTTTGKQKYIIVKLGFEQGAVFIRKQKLVDKRLQSSVAFKWDRKGFLKWELRICMQLSMLQPDWGLWLVCGLLYSAVDGFLNSSFCRNSSSVRGEVWVGVLLQ